MIMLGPTETEVDLKPRQLTLTRLDFTNVDEALKNESHWIQLNGLHMTAEAVTKERTWACHTELWPTKISGTVYHKFQM